MLRSFLILMALTATPSVAAPETAAGEQPAPTTTVERLAPTAAELMASMDANLQSEAQRSTANMLVNDGRRERSFKMTIVSRGRYDSAVEYLEPAREKGTKMLKTEGQMWLYLPKAERVQKISGHMMRQGMMGSDMSYEDMMTDADFDDMYDGAVIGSEMVDGRKQWKLEATAKDKTITYPKRMIWIDDGYRVPTKQELYAVSGMLMKTWTMSDIKVIDGKNIPMKMVIDDALKEGSSTTFIQEEVSFDVEVDDDAFSRRWLER